MSSYQSDEGAPWYVALLLIVLLVAGGGLAYVLISGEDPLAAILGTGGEDADEDADEEGDGADEGAEPDELEPASFSDYSWSELAQVADLVAAAGSDEEAAAIAEEWGVSVGSTRSVTLDDGTRATLTVVGLCADELADGSGVAGLTLMLSQISTQAMNSEDTAVGGWESSELRNWLASEGLALLPDELEAEVATVTKTTNNTGKASSADAVSTTEDTLWLFSVSEVCGEVTWFVDEFGEPLSSNGWTDFSTYDELLSAEGEQYEYFADAGVTGESGGSGVLALTDATTTPWWYRTPYPYSFDGWDSGCFYQVMGSGYPSSVGLASSEAGVVVGLCL